MPEERPSTHYKTQHIIKQSLKSIPVHWYALLFTQYTSKPCN